MCKLYQLSTHINNFLRWYCSKKGASCDRFTIVWLQFEKICLILSELIQNNLQNWTHLDALQVFLMQKRKKKPNFYVKFFLFEFLFCVTTLDLFSYSKIKLYVNQKFGDFYIVSCHSIIKIQLLIIINVQMSTT